MHLVFLVQASPAIGMGHLMRCLGLAQFACYAGGKALFLTDSETRQYIAQREDWVGEYRTLCSFSNDDILHALAEINRDKAVSWCVVDGYQFTSDFCQSLRNQNFSIALFEDGMYKSPYGADVIINSASRTSVDCINFNDSKALLGDKYRVMRKEFSHLVATPLVDRQKLVICFGGSDPSNLTLPVLKILDEQRWQSELCVVTGQGYSSLDALRRFLDNTALVIQHIHSAQNMAQIWSQARLAVSAAGGSQFELAVCNTPSILVAVADNQIEASSNASREGWCKVIDARTEKSRVAKSIVELINTLWPNETLLKTMHDAVEGIYDANGAVNLYHALEQITFQRFDNA